MRRSRRFPINQMAQALHGCRPLRKTDARRPQADNSFQEKLRYHELEMGRGLREYLLAADWAEACEALKRNPILLRLSASEILRSAIAEARQRQDAQDEAILQDHLAVLELAREEGIEAVLRELRDIQNEG